VTRQELAQTGAAVGGVGVIASFIYVAIQIRNNTRAVRAATFQQLVSSLVGQLLHVEPIVETGRPWCSSDFCRRLDAKCRRPMLADSVAKVGFDLIDDDVSVFACG
jgi:hypothetical protein